MQIHEITRRQKVDEGLLDKLKDKVAAASGAVVKGIKQSSNIKKNIAKKIKDTSIYKAGKEISGAVQSGVEQIRQAERDLEQEKRDEYLKVHTEKYVNDLAKQWMASAPKLDTTKPVEQPDTQEKPTTLPTTQQDTTQQDTTQLKTSKSDRDEYIAAQNRQMSAQSGIKEAKARQRRVQARKDKRNPNQTVSQTQQPAEPLDPQDKYANEFKKWASQKLKTRVKNQDITFNQIENNPELDVLMDNIKDTIGNPAENQEAVREYLLKAVNLIQAKAKEIRQNTPDEEELDFDSDDTSSSRLGPDQVLAIDPRYTKGIRYFKYNGNWYQDFSNNPAEFNTTKQIRDPNNIAKLMQFADKRPTNPINVKQDISGTNKLIVKNK